MKITRFGPPGTHFIGEESPENRCLNWAAQMPRRGCVPFWSKNTGGPCFGHCRFSLNMQTKTNARNNRSFETTLTVDALTTLLCDDQIQTLLLGMGD